MNSTEFLKNELQLIATKFPSVHIKYGYNSMIETHIVELLPLIEFTTNVELDNTWIPLSLKFMEIFKDEEVAFISSDSSLSLKNVIFEFNESACTEEGIITELFAALMENTINYTFPTDIPNGILIGSSIISFLSLPIEKLSDEHYSDNSYLAAA
jgi:hypothetical protein